MSVTRGSCCVRDRRVPLPVQDLRQQMGGLQGQLQQVQVERSTLQSRLKTSQAEIDSLQQVRQWYQQQLATAQEARVRLQGEMANMQVRLLDSCQRLEDEMLKSFFGGGELGFAY